VGNGFPTRPSGKDPGVYKNYTEVIIMVVQHNMQAANANRMLNLTVNGQQKSTEKLSSGYRINRAADDAAGLAISEKMRSQIRGLDRASTNAQDGISVVQTAEGALNEVHSMLQRMNELATQAANDTNTSNDRAEIQLEVDQLTSEIDRVASTTQFNTMNLLDGSFTGKNLQVGSLSGQTIELSIGSMNAHALGLEAGKETLTADRGAQHGHVAAFSGNSADTTVTWDNSKSSTTDTYIGAQDIDFGGSTPAAATTYVLDANGSWHKKGDAFAESVSVTLKNGIKATAGAEIGVDTTGKVTGVTDASKFKKGGAALTKDDFNAEVDPSVKNGTYTYDAKNSQWLGSDGKAATGVDAGKLGLAAAPQDGATITIAGQEDAKTKGDTITTGSNLSVTTHDGAEEAMTRVQTAIDKVSSQRATLGAVQNRLEHTIANLDTTSENTQAAESRIRDTDMAKEMVTWSKNNILAQAGQSMLAQANQSNQGVLSLLQ